MNRLLLLIILLLVLKGTTIFAQLEYKPIRFFYRPSIGAMFPTRSFSSKYITDNLIETKFQNLFCQPLGIGFFFRNIGIEGHLALSPVQNPQNRRRQFVKGIDQIYGDRYYTSISYGAIANYSSENSDPLTRGSIGPSYKIEKSRFIFVGRVMVGAVSINTYSARARLKVKGTNELLHIDWKTEYPNKDCFSINPSFTFAYRVNRRITFDLDLDSWFYKTDVTYVESITNAVPGSVTTKQYGYNHLMNDVSIGLGIMVVFK